jgi:putative nucleotidyltransferase with HDIG domain
MYPLAIVADTPDSAELIRGPIAKIFAPTMYVGRAVPSSLPPKFVLVDINLKDNTSFAILRDWLNRRPDDGVVVFAIDAAQHRQSVQAHALGATASLRRPIVQSQLLKILLGDLSSVATPAPEEPGLAQEGVSAGIDALRNIFAAAALQCQLDPTMVDEAGDKIVGSLHTAGLVEWVDTVRRYHSQTYQHCLLVTGVAVAYGQHLGFAWRDRRKLAFSGLLHDIGKAQIPLAILEKPGPLEGDEITTMRQHPVFGYETVKAMPGFAPDMHSIVRHHHEYLDGSGYPDRLKGAQISDLVRIMTIADIYGALIERRSYKEPMTGAAAFRILRDMGPKLDPDLVREFEPVTRMQLQPVLTSLAS